MPLKAYQDMPVFKLFMLDVGLLGAFTGLDAKTLIDGNAIFTEFKGSLTEQFVMQELTTLKVDYVGFDIENDFVVGYGMDYNNKGRNLKSIYTLVKT